MLSLFEFTKKNTISNNQKKNPKTNNNKNKTKK